MLDNTIHIMDKVLSIIVPTYNMEACLEKNLKSLILEYGEERLEVIVVNDGSTDKSSEIAHTFQTEFPNVFKVIDKTNGNYGCCINAGLKSVCGKYVKIMDADDNYFTHNLKSFIDYLESQDADLVFNDYLKYYAESDKEIVSFSIPSCVMLNVKDYYDSDAMANIQMPAITYKTEILQRMGYRQTEGISYTDMEWCFLPIYGVKTISYFNRQIYCYMLNRAGQTMDPSVQVKKFSMVIQSLSNILHTYAGFQLDCDCKRYYIDQLLRHSLYVYRFYLVVNKTLERDSLFQFDKVLSTCCPEAYENSGEFEYRLHLPYKYVAEWRKNGRKDIPKYILAAEAILDFVGSLRKKIRNYE